MDRYQTAQITAFCNAVRRTGTKLHKVRLQPSAMQSNGQVPNCTRSGCSPLQCSPMDRYQTAQGQVTALCNAVRWTGTELHREIPEVGGPSCLKFMLSGNEMEKCCLCSSSGECLQYCWDSEHFRSSTVSSHDHGWQANFRVWLDTSNVLADATR
jgi:hypothetical protein